MLQLLNKQRYIRLIVITLLLSAVSYVMFTPVWVLPESATVFYPLFQKLFTLKPWQLFCILLINFVLQIALLLLYTQKCAILQSKSKLPILLHLFFSLIILYKSGVSPLFFTNTFLLIVLNLNNEDFLHRNTQNFYIGLVLGICVWVDLTIASFILYALITLLFREFSSFKYLIHIAIGLLSSWIYMVCYYLFSNQIDLLLPMVENSLLNFNFTVTQLSVRNILGMSSIFFLSIVFIIVNRIKFNNRLIVTRQKVGNFHIFVFFAMVSILFSNFSYPQSKFLILAYLPILLSIFIENNKIKYLNELVFLIFCLLLWV